MTREVYNRSVDVLLDAYNKNHLFHGNCAACAVGNLIAAAKGYRITDDRWYEDTKRVHIKWDYLFVTNGGIQTHVPENRFPQIIDQIQSTGISENELMSIEYAFEVAIFQMPEGYYHYIDKDRKKGQYIGLCAVLDVMKDMVEDDLPVKEELPRLNAIAQSKGVEVNV